MNIQGLLQKPLSFLRNTTRKQKIIVAALGTIIIFLFGIFAFVSSTQKPAVDNSYKTWKILLSYSVPKDSLTLKSLTLLNQTIRPDYRLQKFSSYKLLMLNKKNDILYQTGIPIVDSVVEDVGSQSTSTYPGNIESLVFVPWREGAIEIRIIRDKKTMLDISLPQQNSFNVLSQTFAEGIQRADGRTCGPLQTVIINDNYTNIAHFRSDVQRIENIFRSTAPYSTTPNLFDFKEIDQPQNYGCKQIGLPACFTTKRPAAINVATSAYPEAGALVVLTDSLDAPPAGVARGVSSPGSMIGFFSNYANDFQDAGPHEFEGHGIGWLYDTYVLKDPASLGLSKNLFLSSASKRTNCSDNPNGESWWKTADPNSGVFPGSCYSPDYYSPYHPTCAGSSIAISLGNQGIMSAIGCAQGNFTPVESYWITHNILPEFAACPTPTPSPSPTQTISSGNNSVHVVVYIDTNNNQTKDSGEAGLTNAKVTLSGPGVSKTQFTDGNGTTDFTSLSGGDFTIKVDASLLPEPLFAAISLPTGKQSKNNILIPVSPQSVLSPTPITSSGSPTPDTTNPTEVKYTCKMQPDCNTPGADLQLCTLICTATTSTTEPTPSGPRAWCPDSLGYGKEPFFPYLDEKMRELFTGLVPADSTCKCVPSDSKLHCENNKVVGCEQGELDYTSSGLPDKCSRLAKQYPVCDNVPTGYYCIGKPVIYLYPTKDTLVNVKLDIPGTVTVSDPKYPDATGWQNVLAHPDGTLDYQNKTYHELYYETSVSKSIVPQTGILVATGDLKQKLTSITSKLGLLPAEQQEFLEYWLPKLQALHSNYIFVSLLSQEQKDSVDKVSISPQPDTLIEYLFTFKGVEYPFAFAQWKLPQTPPQRVGFTAVEWGGTILH
ncbi:MAG TPA: SdrD B-like domain-containing protein [Candidatus Saccharimonadales bacterium]|nr:SdrD B-like domain-containing protein [Candidatus Saccharimonadales bacterium]